MSVRTGREQTTPRETGWLGGKSSIQQGGRLTGVEGAGVIRWAAVAVCIASLVGPAGLGVAGAGLARPFGDPQRDEPPRSTMNWLVFGDDPDRPGAGVMAVEEVRSGGKDGAPASAPIGRPRKCEVYETRSVTDSIAGSLGGDIKGDTSPRPIPNKDMEVGTEYHMGCRYTDDDSLAYLDDFTYNPARPTGRPRVDALARQVYAEVPLVFPTPHTSPPIDEVQLVGLPVWLWLEDDVWRTFDASASVAGVTVTVVAEPSTAVWNMGDGATVRCNGPGTPWSPGSAGGSGRGRRSEKSDCSHTYQFVSDSQPGGRYQASVTVTWTVSWRASTGETGTLPAASRTTGFELDVRQRQAIISYDS